MLFAHGPLGSLIASSVGKKYWKQSSRKDFFRLLFIGFVGGIIPDIDLFYTYLIDATKSHREFITHTPIFYVSLFLLIFLMIRRFFPGKVFLRRAVIIFFLGTASHIITDGVMAQIPWLYPFRKDLFGLGDVTFLMPYLFSFNYSVEFCFVGMFGWLLWMEVFPKHSLAGRRLVGVLTGFFTLLFIGSAWVIDAHNMPIDFNTPYEDVDRDGVRNRVDLDMDGDGVVNSHDIDSDGDGVLNDDQLLRFMPRLRGVWHDPTNGYVIELIARLGLPSQATFVHDVFDFLGIYLEREMAADYSLLPGDYDTHPEDAYFRNSIHNIRIWLNHTGRLLPARMIISYHQGDIVFFGENGDEHVAIISSVSISGEAYVVHSDAGYSSGPVLLSDLSAAFGRPVFVGRILYPITSQMLLSSQRNFLTQKP